jgi:hypothetical protein
MKVVAEPPLVEANEADHVTLGGAGSRWSGDGAIHSGHIRLVLGRSSPSSTSSSNLLSVAEEAAQSSAGRIWLFPAIGATESRVDGEGATAAALDVGGEHKEQRTV